MKFHARTEEDDRAAALPQTPPTGDASPHNMVSIAPFRFDVTPPLGHALLGGLVPPAQAIDDDLEAIGYVLLTDEAPIVVCALDWAGLMNSSHHRFRATLASAANTSPDRVALHCVHQHNTPFVCEETRRCAAHHADLSPIFDPVFFQHCLDSGAVAVKNALENPLPITHIAHGKAEVQQVASNRRVDRDEHGNVLSMRGSACSDPALIDLPEGLIDPFLQTIAFYSEKRKIVSCHTYATHPMSYYRDGRVTSDFCGLARKQRQKEDPNCTHLYFTGCAGNIAAGKYNDGSPTARAALTNRMHEAIVRAEASLSMEPLRTVKWSQTPLALRARPTPPMAEVQALVSEAGSQRAGKILHAYWTTWERQSQSAETIELSCLELNGISQLHLPGEPFIEYQLHAQTLRPDAPVITVGYGDGGPWYIPKADEYPLGGYETEVAFSEPSIDNELTRGIEFLLAPTDTPAD